MGRSGLGVISLCLVTVLIFTTIGFGAEKIKLLCLVQEARIDKLRRFFDGEPSLGFTVIVTRDIRLPDNELKKLIRLYFPRRYREMAEFDVLMLLKPSYELFTPTQDKWIHDAVFEGAGGINDGSIFSQIAGIPDSWAISQAQEAFPNDAPAVLASYASWAPRAAFNVQINRDHDEPILTVFVPFGVEKEVVAGVSRVVIPRPGSAVLAWQLGNYPSKEPYLVSWKYGEGRSMTIGNPLPSGWLSYPTGPSGYNQYSPEILMNMLFWLADTELIDDVEVFHRIKTYFTEYTVRLKVMISLMDFIDRFGANTDRIQEEVNDLDEIYAEASGHYLEHSFVDSEVIIKTALSRFQTAEEVAKREKDRALAWVYLIEWIVSSSTMFISGFIIWTLMVRRKLYRAVEMTKLRTMDR